MTNKTYMKNQQSNKDEIYYKTQMIDFIVNNNSDAILVSEFPFNFQKRRADLLVIEEGMTHAIEIKSDVDNITKLSEQIDDYIISFNKVSIFISEKHIKALNCISKNIGVYILKDNKIKAHRKATIRKRLNKSILLDMLPTVELKAIIDERNLSRIELIDKISNEINYSKLNRIHAKSLERKMSPIYNLFTNERMNNETTIHDLSILEIRNTLL